MIIKQQYDDIRQQFCGILSVADKGSNVYNSVEIIIFHNIWYIVSVLPILSMG